MSCVLNCAVLLLFKITLLGLAGFATKPFPEKDMLFKVPDDDLNVSTLKKDQVGVLDPLISFYLKQLAG